MFLAEKVDTFGMCVWGGGGGGGGGILQSKFIQCTFVCF